jgi:hypothetical protein
MSRIFQVVFGDRRRQRLRLLAVAVVCLLNVPSAQAVEPFGPLRAFPAMGHGCAGGATAAGALLRNFGACDRWDDSGANQADQLAYYELARDGWHGRILPITGFPLAAAQDRGGAYLLFEIHRGLQRGAAILKRDPQGRYSYRQLHAEDAVGSGSLVVRNGKWWAVWTCPRGGGHEYSLCESGTLFGPTAARQITTSTYSSTDFLPSLALRTDGRLDLLWSRSQPTIDGSNEELRFASTTGEGWHSQALRTTTNQSFVGSIATDGLRTFAAWTQNGHPVVASDESGRLTARELPTRSCANSATVAASGLSVVVVINQCAAGDAENNPTGTAVVVLERRGGGWTSITLDRHTSGSGLIASEVRSFGDSATVRLYDVNHRGAGFTRSQSRS